jgi:hypothetical protein
VEKIVRYRGLTAHARARYRCFLPDLAGLAGVRRVRPIPDLKHSSIRDRDYTVTNEPCALPFAVFEGVGVSWPHSTPGNESSREKNPPRNEAGRAPVLRIVELRAAQLVDSVAASRVEHLTVGEYG